MTEHATDNASRYGHETRARRQLRDHKPDKRHADGPRDNKRKRKG